MKTLYAILISAVIAGSLAEKPAAASSEPTIHLLIKAKRRVVRIETQDQMRDRIAVAHGHDPLQFAAMERIESNGRASAERFEPGEVNRARRLAPKASEKEIRYLATSHCSMQVMGWHEILRHLPRGALKDQETCYEVAAHVLALCKEKRKGTDGSACYNGSQRYARLVAAEIRKTKKG